MNGGRQSKWNVRVGADGVSSHNSSKESMAGKNIPKLHIQPGTPQPPPSSRDTPNPQPKFPKISESCGLPQIIPTSQSSPQLVRGEGQMPPQQNPSVVFIHPQGVAPHSQASTGLNSSTASMSSFPRFNKTLKEGMLMFYNHVRINLASTIYTCTDCCICLYLYHSPSLHQNSLQIVPRNISDWFDTSWNYLPWDIFSPV